MNYELLAKTQNKYVQTLENNAPQLIIDFKKYVEKVFDQNEIDGYYKQYYCNIGHRASLTLSTSMLTKGKNFNYKQIYQTINEIKEEFPKKAKLENILIIEMDNGTFEFT